MAENVLVNYDVTSCELPVIYGSIINLMPQQMLTSVQQANTTALA